MAGLTTDFCQYTQNVYVSALKFRWLYVEFSFWRAVLVACTCIVKISLVNEHQFFHRPFMGKLEFMLVKLVVVYCIFLFVPCACAIFAFPNPLRKPSQMSQVRNKQVLTTFYFFSISLWLFTYKTLITFDRMFENDQQCSSVFFSYIKTPFMNSIHHFQSIFHIFISH